MKIEDFDIEVIDFKKTTLFERDKKCLQIDHPIYGIITIHDNGGIEIHRSTDQSGSINIDRNGNGKGDVLINRRGTGDGQVSIMQYEKETCLQIDTIHFIKKEGQTI